MFACAFDLGASGGRVMLGEFTNGQLSLSEMHRFPNEPVQMGGTLYWDVPRLFHEMKAGLKKIASEGIPLTSIGIDTWGVDYGLLDSNSNLIGLPVHYRDARNSRYPSASAVPARELYNRTGIQHLNFNTVFQLMADYNMRPDVLRVARDLLFMPDLFTYFLTGQKVNEYTIASTSQLLNAFNRDWDGDLAAQITPFDLRKLFRPVTMPGTVIGPLTGEVLAETGLNPSVRMVAVGSHDTASAVAGTPFSGDGHAAYLSCGTWSLLGMEMNEPIITEQSLDYNFTNEGGLDNKIRFLRNINGLWIIQQLRKSYNRQADRQRPMEFSDLIRAAEEAKDAPFRVSPNDPCFTNPIDMAEAVRAFCVRQGQGEPKTVGETAIAVYNGLADEYASVLRNLEQIAGLPFDTLHMVGGGVQDTFLCRLTANATKKRVVAGPVEASALGNVIAQLVSLKAVDSLNDGRAVIRRSFAPTVYDPE